MLEKVKLGMEVRDKISGLQGIVTSITEFLYGCRRLGVTPQKLDEKNKPMEESVIDEPQLVIVGEGIRGEEEVLPTAAAKRKRNYGNPDFVPTKRSVDLRR